MNKGRGFQNGWWLVLLTMGIMYITATPFMFTDADNIVYLISNELMLIFPVIVGLFMINSDNSNISIFETLGIRRFSLKLLPFLIIIAPCAQVFCSYLLAPVQSLLTLILGAEDYEQLLGGLNNDSFWGNFVVICILAPIIEELLCRGILMQLFKRYGISVMLVFSSLAFALLHQSLASLIPIFFLGMLLGIVRITTNSLFACMIVHSASNLFSLLMLYSGDINSIANILIMICCIVLFPLLIWNYLTKICNLHNITIVSESNISSIGMSFGLILCCVIFFITNTALLISRLYSGELFYEISMFFN